MAIRRTPENVPDEADVDARSDAPTQETLIAEPPGDGWTPPRAVSYPSPRTAPTPQADLDDPDLPYWLALTR